MRFITLLCGSIYFFKSIAILFKKNNDLFQMLNINVNSSKEILKKHLSSISSNDFIYKFDITKILRDLKKENYTILEAMKCLKNVGFA